MNQTAALVSLATGIPPYEFHQKQILEAAHHLLRIAIRSSKRYPPVCQHRHPHRYGVKPIEWYLEPRGWPERTQAFPGRRGSPVRRRRAKSHGAGRSWRNDIDTVVTVCSTGIATPTLEARVAGRLGFRRDVSRVPVLGLAAPAASRDYPLHRDWRKPGQAPTYSWWSSNFARSPFATTN